MNTIDTAYFTAACRAAESARPDALFHDHLAGMLAGERGMAMTRDIPDVQDVVWSVVVRTMVMDQMIEAIVRDQRVDAILNLGAELDARPYRMKLASMVFWIELDLHPVIGDKASLPGVTRFAVDLGNTKERSEALDGISSRFNRILVLSEGLIPYLTAGQFRGLTEDLASRPQFRWWLTDVVAPLHARRAERLLDRPLYTPDVSGFTVLGWRELMYRSLNEEAARVSRGPRAKDMGYRYPSAVETSSVQCRMPRTSGVVLLENCAISSSGQSAGLRNPR